MKKIIAKGMAAFLLVLVALTLMIPICHAAEKDEGYSVEVHSRTPVNVELDEGTLTIKNQSTEKIYAYVKISDGHSSETFGWYGVESLKTYEIDINKFSSADVYVLKESTVPIIETWISVVTVMMIAVAAFIICKTSKKNKNL